MSRATAAPSAAPGTGAPTVVVRSGMPAATAPAPSRSRSADRRRVGPGGHPGADARAGLRRRGGRRGLRPGRRHVALVLRGRAGAGRPQHRPGGADPDASTPTSSGPTPPRPARSSSAASRTPVQRADYDAAWTASPQGIAAAAEAQPADSDALGALNAAVQDYAATIEEARVYNRQGLPVGAQYLSGGSDHAAQPHPAHRQTPSSTPTRPGPTRSSTPAAGS